MSEGTVTNLILCGVLVVGFGFAFWFNEILPGDRRSSSKRKTNPTRDTGRTKTGTFCPCFWGVPSARRHLHSVKGARRGYASCME